MAKGKHKTLEIGQEAALARFFSSTLIRELAHKGWSPLANRLIDEIQLFKFISPKISYREFFEWAFHILRKSYRHEYIYVNAIAEKILLGIHSLNTSCMLTEFRAGQCKADVVLLNGTATVYEVKSARDNLDRLGKQLNAYADVFDYIQIITDENHVPHLEKYLPAHVGILLLTNRYQVHTYRDAQSRIKLVKPAVIFESLRRKEYVSILKKHFSEIPSVPNTQIHGVCKELFSQLSPKTAHEAMVLELKKRKQCKKVCDFIISMPKSLKAAALSIQLSQAEQDKFSNLLNEEIGKNIRSHHA